MGRLKCVATLSSSSTILSNSYISEASQHDEFQNDIMSNNDLEIRKLTSYIPSDSILSYTTSPVWSCVWSTDGQRLASCHGAPDSCVRIWMRRPFSMDDDTDEDDTKNYEKESYILIATLQQQQQNSQKNHQQQRTIRSAAFAPTISTNVRYILAVASFDGTVSIWEDFSTNIFMENTTTVDSINYNSNNGWECTAQLEGHENEVKDVTWNSTGTLLATCGRDKSVWIWECFLPGSIGGDVRFYTV
jgi:WD40 repeat protein